VSTLHSFLRILDSDGNLVKDSSGNIIILTTPWTYTDIRSIQVAHKISALFVVCADKAPHRVFRRTINEWSVDTISSEGIRENPQTRVCFRERLWQKDSRVPLSYPKEMVFLPS
jgi:hypothetical protein